MTVEAARPAPPDRWLTGKAKLRSREFLDRRELSSILVVYGRGVVAGIWRDYAIGGGEDAAVFAILRHAGETPLYRIEKRPALASRQGAWAVIGQGGIVLRRGRELAPVLRVFDRRGLRLVS